MSETLRRDPDDAPLELTITRVIDAPRSLVWTVWTDPDHAKHWGPRGFTVEYFLHEARPGAPWRARLRPDDGGPDLWQGGVYREIVEPERLVFTFAWDDEDGQPCDESLITVTFEEHDGRTTLTLHQLGFSSVESRDGHAEGWGEAIDSLGAHAMRLREDAGAKP